MTAAGPRRLVLVAALLLFLLPGVAHAAPNGVGALRICTGCAQSGGDLSRYRYVVLNSWDAPLLPALKAANPGLKVLLYKNLSFTMSYGCSNGVDKPYLTSGVGYCDADQNHPDWFLTDPNGSRLNSYYFQQAWMMDVGNPAYQARWLSNVLDDLRGGGWDGVMLDDTNADMSWHLHGRTIAKYPTAAAWRAATRSMLATVGPALRGAGFLAIPNLYAPWASDYDAQATWSDWLQFTSGALQEYYSKWGSDSSGWLSGNDWAYRQKFQTLTEQAGKIFIGLTYAPKGDTRSMTWARANFLLFDDPADGGALMFEPTDPEAQDPYASTWTADIGSPVAARVQVGSTWRRSYSGGVVVVNPTSSTATVDLGGSYVDAGGAVVQSVTLGATSGAILRSPAGAPPPPPLPPPLPPPPPVAATLTATFGGATVQLAWSGLAGARVDVYRNGGRKETVANTGSYSDKLLRNPKETYSYRVCTAGTSTCTPTVIVATGSRAPAAAAPSLRRARRNAHAQALRLRRELHGLQRIRR
ncbi:MAG TPA: putative glycoside hydrolase [Gaiellaceae bacterium]|nr:putative glycoside hydrolase [Gaiellaceae bacterium]